MNNSELKSEFRDLKLKVINNEVKLSISDDRIEVLSDKLEFIQNTFPNDIISGSLALKLFGLLNRDHNDIDILIKDKGRYSDYSFKYKKGFLSRTIKYDVDFFHDIDSSYTECKFNGKILKIHNPLEVINYKINMIMGSNDSNHKHRNDLDTLFYYSNFNKRYNSISAIFG